MNDDMIPRDEAKAMVAAALTEAADICDMRNIKQGDSDYITGVIDASQADATRIRALIDAPAEAALARMLAEARAKGMKEAARTCETHGALGGPTPNPYAEWKTHADNLAATILARAAEVKEGGA